ncbi:9268_t:CDS:2, partial [Racocetra persica]
MEAPLDEVMRMDVMMRCLLKLLTKTECDSNDADNINGEIKECERGVNEKQEDTNRKQSSLGDGIDENKPNTNLEIKMPPINGAAKSPVESKDLSADQTEGDVEGAKDMLQTSKS